MDALALAEQAGIAKASNVALMGVVAAKTDFDDKLWQDALEQCVPANGQGVKLLGGGDEFSALFQIWKPPCGFKLLKGDDNVRLPLFEDIV